MMKSVAECTDEYLRSPLKAVVDIRDALARFEQAYDLTLVEDFWDDCKWWQISQNGPLNPTDVRVCERLKFVFSCIALAGKSEPEFFGILIPKQHKPDDVKWISWFMQFIQTATVGETIRLAIYPLWEFEKKLEVFELAILRSNRFAKPNTANQRGDGDSHDGPDTKRMTLVLGGHDFGPFTSTQFDVVQMMWDHRESKWTESDAFFIFHAKFGWVQTAESPFGKHQTDIKAVFVANGFELPWRRLRGSFVWRGLVEYSKRPAKKPQAKPGQKRNVSRGKKR